MAYSSLLNILPTLTVKPLLDILRSISLAESFPPATLRTLVILSIAEIVCLCGFLITINWERISTSWKERKKTTVVDGIDPDIIDFSKIDFISQLIRIWLYDPDISRQVAAAIELRTRFSKRFPNGNDSKKSAA